MTHSDPHQVIIDYLSTTRIIISDEAHSGGWHKQRSSGGMSAKAETIRFLKERAMPRRQLHYVTFEDDTGRTLFFTCYVTQDERDAWQFHGGSGGGGGGKMLVREHPWANLGGGGWPNDFYAGGYVIDNGLDITRVRLIATNGTVLEDTVEDAIVLFLGQQPVEIPLQAELYDRTGTLVASHSAFDFKNRKAVI